MNLSQRLPLLSSAPLLAPILTAQPVSFDKQVRPILARNCAGCHQPASRQSGLSLDHLRRLPERRQQRRGLHRRAIRRRASSSPISPARPSRRCRSAASRCRTIRSTSSAAGSAKARRTIPPPTRPAAVPTGPIIYHAPPVITAHRHLARRPDAGGLRLSRNPAGEIRRRVDRPPARALRAPPHHPLHARWRDAGRRGRQSRALRRSADLGRGGAQTEAFRRGEQRYAVRRVAFARRQQAGLRLRG